MLSFSKHLTEKIETPKPKKQPIKKEPDAEKNTVRMSPTGWPEHMHQAHTDGTHGGMQW
jgi:hypothetical protein